MLNGRQRHREVSANVKSPPQVNLAIALAHNPGVKRTMLE